MSELAPPLKWHGGKTYLAKWIRSLSPRGRYVHRVHPYGGGLGEFWNWRREGVSEVVNDIDGRLGNLWLILQNPEMFKDFQTQLQMTPFSEEVFNHAEHQQHKDIIGAVNFFIRVRQSRQGLAHDFATLSRTRTRRGMNEQVSAWLSAVEGLPAIHARLQQVVILCRPALDVIAQQDGPKTFFYCDPPYLHETRTATNAYAYEMTREDHKKLLYALSHIKGLFALSGYHSNLYDSWAAVHGYKCHEREIDNKASSSATKEKKVECLWTNDEEDLRYE